MSSQSAIPENQSSIFPSGLPGFRVGERALRLSVMSDPAGVLEVPALRRTIISIHAGPSVQVTCKRAGQTHRGTVIQGDMDIIPAGVPSVWEMNAKDTRLVLALSQRLLDSAAEDLDCDPSRVEIRNCFQVRDPQLENIGAALRAEVEAGYPCGRLYFDSLSISVAARLLRCHSSISRPLRKMTGRLSDRRLRQVFGYIEDNLGRELSLSEIATVAGVSVSHFKTLFRESVGIPAHQYVIRRRLERAKSLLVEGKLSISQIALETGFAHQSHLAHHMRRVLGVSPRALREMLR
jgi:AraC family transcriptional regulator